MEGQADDEGWITVTRVGKNKGAPRTEAEAKRVTSKDKKRRKEKVGMPFFFVLLLPYDRIYRKFLAKTMQEKNKFCLLRRIVLHLHISVNNVITSIY